MKQFEYLCEPSALVITLTAEEKNLFYDKQALVIAQKRAEYLNKRGLEGWELVCYETDLKHFIFKRELKPDIIKGE